MHGTYDAPKKPMPKQSGMPKKGPKSTPKGGKKPGFAFPSKGK